MPPRRSKLIRRTRTTGVMGAPPMFAALVREARRVGAAPPLRFAMAGGAALATELARAVEETFGCALRDGYGMSEVGGGITLTPVDDAAAAGFGRSRVAGQRAADRRSRDRSAAAGR